jgi:16S rRNA (guanine527-N7)-methyltransferase
MQLKTGAAVWGLDLDPSTLERFSRFAQLLDEGNRRLNLTRVAPEDSVTLHFLDSLSLAAILKPTPGTHLIDVGTGAGFPGVPLALAFPEIQVTLLDSTTKRLVFLDETLRELHLTHVRTFHGRAEDLARTVDQREKYGLATARAVAKMPTLAGWLLPLIRPGGRAIAYKSRHSEEEIARARPLIAELGGSIEQIADVILPESDILRKLVVLRKDRATPLRPIRQRSAQRTR